MFCAHTHTYTHTHTYGHFLLLPFTVPRDSFEQRHTGKRKGTRAVREAKMRARTDSDSSSDNSSITPCVWVFLRVSANVCVCPGACVRCVSQDCQHISSQREPYRNRDICGVKGRQLARPSLEKEGDGRRRGVGRGRGTGRRMEESRRMGGGPNLVCQPIIRGGVLYS